MIAGTTTNTFDLNNFVINDQSQVQESAILKQSGEVSNTITVNNVQIETSQIIGTSG